MNKLRFQQCKCRVDADYWTLVHESKERLLMDDQLHSA